MISSDIIVLVEMEWVFGRHPYQKVLGELPGLPGTVAMLAFELETAKIAVAFTHSPHIPKDTPVPGRIMLLTTGPGCNKPSICIASVLP